MDAGAHAWTTREGRPSTGMVAGICALLVMLVFMVFGQTLGHEFINLDDDTNVYDNPAVMRGLSFQDVAWAFTHTQVSRWVPVTTLAHMADSGLYGTWAGGHHLTGVLLHAANAMLLFLLLLELTSALGRSAFAAALWAVHPLRVEAVAWVSALQYVLGGFFFLLTLWAYVRYVRGPASWLRYGVVVICFALGLLAKEMLVTLPFVLLLLDFWPLRRMTLMDEAEPGRRSLGRLIGEKIPLFLLSALFCGITVIAGQDFIRTTEQYSFIVRVGNAVVSYAVYLGQMVFPAGLAIWYPHPGMQLSWAEVAVSLAVLAAISGAVWILRQRRPYLLMGWLWYGVMLVPVIGLIQQGDQARCDRYTYLAQIGLCVAVTWGVAEWTQGWRHRRTVLGSVAPLVLVTVAVAGAWQASYWRDSVTLWTHTLACGDETSVAYNNLGSALLLQGRTDEAIEQGRAAVRLDPANAQAHNNLANALMRKGEVDEAIGEYQEALQVYPGFAQAHYNLGVVLQDRGKLDQAIAQYREAVADDPDYAYAHNNLGAALFKKGRVEEAMAEFEEALRLQPDDAELQRHLANAQALARQRPSSR